MAILSADQVTWTVVVPPGTPMLTESGATLLTESDLEIWLDEENAGWGVQTTPATVWTQI